MGFGIALAGGGARGAAHVGVLLALEEAGLRPCSVAGASAGAIVGGLYAAGLSAGRLRVVVHSLNGNSKKLLDPDIAGLARALFRFFTFRLPDLEGLIKGDKLQKFLCGLSGGCRMKDTVLKTVIPAVDLKTGDTVVYTNRPLCAKPLPHVQWRSDALLCEVMRASASFPGVFRPKELENFCLVDGGVTDNLPVNLLIAAGEKKVLGVDVSEEYEMPKNKNLMEVASHSLTILTSRLKELTSTGEKLLLRPELPEDAGLLTFDCLDACLDAGYACARAHMDEIRVLCCE